MPPPSVTQNKQYSDIRLVYEYTKSRSPKTVSDRVPPLSPRRFRRVVDDAIERARGRARRRPRLRARRARDAQESFAPLDAAPPLPPASRARAREIDARGRPPRARAPPSVRAAPPSARRPSARARDAIARSPHARTVSASARAVRRPSRARVADVAARSNVAARGDRDDVERTRFWREKDFPYSSAFSPIVACSYRIGTLAAIEGNSIRARDFFNFSGVFLRVASSRDSSMGDSRPPPEISDVDRV